MKILWVMNKQLDTASDRAYISILCNHIEQLGASVEVVARFKQHRLPYGGNIIYLTTLSVKYLKTLSYLAQVAVRIFSITRETNADIIVVDRAWLAFSFVPFCLIKKWSKRWSKKKVVLDVRSLPNNITNGLQGRFNILSFNIGLKLASRLFDGCMCITKPMAEYVVDNSSFNIESIGYWSSAFDSSLFDPDKVQPDIRFPFSDSPTIIYHGAMVGNRMLNEVLHAMRLTENSLSLVLLGDGTLLDNLKSTSVKLELKDRVYFLDKVNYEEVPAFLKAADLGIVPIPDTLWFNVSMPIKLLEYMAMGLPIIAPLTSPVTEVSNSAKCDIEVFENTSDFQTQVRRIASAMDAAAIRYHKGYVSSVNREHVLAKYTWKAQANLIVNYLKLVTAG